MHAKILLLTTVLLTGQTYAQNTPETDSKKADALSLNIPEETLPNKIFNYAKEKIAASYHGEYYFTRRDAESSNPEDRKIQDLNYMHSPTLIYTPVKNWQFLVNGEFKYSDSPVVGGSDGTFVNDYYRSLFTFTKKNILVEKEVGIQLDAGIGRRDFNTRTSPTSFGNNRIFTTITKNYGKNNGSLFVQYLHNDPKLASAATWKHGLEVIPTINLKLTEKLSYLFNDDINLLLPKFKTTDRDYSISHEMNIAYLTYQWTDTISTYYQFKYLHSENFANASKDDYFTHYAGVAYALSDKISITGEIGSEIFHGNDGKFFAKKSSYPELALYVDASL